MKRVFIENGQRFIKRIMDWLQSSKEDSDRDRRNDYTDFGILPDALNTLNITIGSNNTPSTPYITIDTGIAYDSTGERVIIEGTLIPYDPTAPSATAPDGKGGTVPAPQSTGSSNISLLPTGEIKYIWITYLETLDTAEFTLQKVTNKKQYFKQEDGYRIEVTTVDTPPSVTSIRLGSVDLTGGLVTIGTINMDDRVFGGNKINLTKVKLAEFNKSDATTDYVPGEIKVVDDHVRAIGTGTVTPENPHGLAPFDIGIDIEASLDQHQQFLHSNGVVGSRALVESSLNLVLVPQTPGDDYVVIKPLISTEVAHVNGSLVDSTDIPNEEPKLFSSVTDADGTYYIYVDKNTKTVKRTLLPDSPPSTTSSLFLWSLFWTGDPGGSPDDGDITAITDLRAFGTTNNDIIDNDDDYEMNRISLNDGLISAPSLTFKDESSSGLYRQSAGDLRLSILGTDRLITNSSEASLAIDANNKISITATSAGIIFGGSSRFSVDSSKISTNLPILAIDGSLGSPSYAFTNSSNTGLALSGVNMLIHVDGINRGQWTPTGLSVVGTNSQIVSTESGTEALPSIALTSAKDIGFYTTGVNNLSLSTNGVRRVSFNDTDVTIDSAQLVLQLSSSSVPSLSFASDLNTGVYSPIAGTIGLSADANKILEATSSNTILYGGGTNKVFEGVDATTTLYAGGNSALTLNSDEVLIKTGFRLQTTDTGTAPDPIIQRNSDPNTGIYWGDDIIYFSTGGTERLHIDNTGVTAQTGNIRVVSGRLIAGMGTAADPSISLSFSHGLFQENSNRISMSVGGQEKTRWNNNQLLQNQSGSITVPSYSFLSATTSGMGYLSSELSLISGGVVKMSMTSTQIELFSGGAARLTVESNNTVELNSGLRRVPHLISTSSTGITTIPTQDIRDHSTVIVTVTGPNVRIKLPTGFGASDAGQEVIIVSNTGNPFGFTAGPITGQERNMVQNDFTKWIWTGSGWARSIGF